MEPLGQRHGGEKGLVWLINWDKASIFLLFFSPLVCRKQINKTAMADVQFLERERERDGGGDDKAAVVGRMWQG